MQFVTRFRTVFGIISCIITRLNAHTPESSCIFYHASVSSHSWKLSQLPSKLPCSTEFTSNLRNSQAQQCGCRWSASKFHAFRCSVQNTEIRMQLKSAGTNLPHTAPHMYIVCTVVALACLNSCCCGLHDWFSTARSEMLAWRVLHLVPNCISSGSLTTMHAWFSLDLVMCMRVVLSQESPGWFHG